MKKLFDQPSSTVSFPTCPLPSILALQMREVNLAVCLPGIAPRRRLLVKLVVGWKGLSRMAVLVLGYLPGPPVR